MSLSIEHCIDRPPTTLPAAVLSRSRIGWGSSETPWITVRESSSTGRTLALKTFVQQLTELWRSQIDWDSYGALPLQQEAAINAVRFFCQVMYDRTPAPQVVPTNTGDIQLEWHIHGIDLEVEICSGGTIHCYFADLKNGKEQEWSESFNYAAALLMPFIEELTRRAMAARMAA